METIELNDELKEIFKRSKAYASGLKLEKLTLSTVLYQLMHYYVSDKSGQDDILNEYFSEHGITDKDIKFIESWIVRNEKKESSLFGPLIGFVNPSSIEVSEQLEEVLKRADIFRTKSTQFNGQEDPFGKDKEYKVESYLFFMASMVEEGLGDEFLKYLSSQFEINSMDWMKFYVYYTTKDEPQLGNTLNKIMNDVIPGSGDNKYTNRGGGRKKNGGDSDDKFSAAGESEAVSSVKVDPDSETPYLDEFSRNMNTDCEKGRFDPVVGRDKEISQIIEILCCRKKNNAVLLGDPGCGKTAIVEGLVQKIVSGDVPEEIKGKRVCSLDLNALVSGTKYRGEYEQRLQGIIKEVCENPNIIVYIDEFHNLVGNGSNSGSGDGANILKPYLARGEFQCIGSTTVDEYRKFIEKDGALKRRFQNVMVSEPTPEETVEILKNLRSKYSEFHRVNYSDEILAKCVEWSGRYISDRFFPDKAIDCMDLAGSFAKLEKSGSSPEQLELKEMEKELMALTTQKIEAVGNQDYETAKVIRDQEKEIEEKVKAKRDEISSAAMNEGNWPEVTFDNIAKVVSKISNVPIDKINKSDSAKLKSMKSALMSKVIGQEEAVSDVVLSLQRNFLGLRDEKKPIASLLFVGPTGTGKTLICKEMAEEFFGSSKSLIRFDMGEFGERHEVTKLTGSTASYVGYDDSPLLEQVRRNPYSVVLFDEIEKAAPEIYNIFLNILDEGKVTLGNGVSVDFKNTIVIFTGKGRFFLTK